MGLRKILTDKDPALHKVCKPVTAFDEKLHKLLDDMNVLLLLTGLQYTAVMSMMYAQAWWSRHKQLLLQAKELSLCCRQAGTRVLLITTIVLRSAVRGLLQAVQQQQQPRS